MLLHPWWTFDLLCCEQNNCSAHKKYFIEYVVLFDSVFTTIVLIQTLSSFKALKLLSSENYSTLKNAKFDFQKHTLKLLHITSTDFSVFCTERLFLFSLQT